LKGRKAKKSPGKKALSGEKTKGNVVRLPANRPGVIAKERDTKQLAVAAALAIIIVLAVYMQFFYQPYTFVIEDRGITYYSNDYTPATFFQEFRKNETIYVSPAVPEKGTNNLIANAMNLWLVVLAGNEITPVQLIRTQDDSGELTGCYTNRGEVKTSELISAEECKAIIGSPENAIVFIELNGTNTAYMEKNRITVNARDEKVVGQVNLFVMKKGFPNAEDIILAVNSSIANIS
jgi:hypothetical protein